MYDKCRFFKLIILNICKMDKVQWTLPRSEKQSLEGTILKFANASTNVHRRH